MGRDMNVKDMAAELVPGRFEVDLTSVCVRVGAIQLPFRLQNTFEEGPITANDAAEACLLELEFRAPRKLAGLHGFFAAHGLRPNDRIALVFEEDGLQIEAIRRDRGAAGKTANARAARALGSDVDRLGDRSGMSNLAAGAADASARPATTASPRTTGVDASEAAGDEEPRQRARSESNTAIEPERKRVVRERIRGNAPPLMTQPDLDAGFQSPASAVTATGAKDRSARSGSNTANGWPRWEPLDVMAPPGGWPEVVEGDLREAARAHGHVIVREVRRSRLGAARALTSTATADTPTTGQRADHALGAGTPGSMAMSGTTVSMRFSSTAEDRDGQQADALQRVLERRSRPHEAPAEVGSSRVKARQQAAKAGEGPDGTRSSPAYGVPADPRRGLNATAQATWPSRPVSAPPAVTRSLSQRPITRTTPMQHGAEPAPRDVGQRETAPRLTWAAAAQPLLQVTAGLKRSLAPERAASHGAMSAGVDAPVNAGTQAARDGHGTYDGQGTHDASLPHRDDHGAGRDEPAGRGLDLFGLRKRLRRGRNAGETRSDTNGVQVRDDDHGSARDEGGERLAGSGDRLGGGVLSDDEAVGSAMPSRGRVTDDFSDAFLEFDEESKGVRGQGAGLRDAGGDRTRPWLPNGEYRPTDTSPWQPGGHIAQRSPADVEAQECGTGHEAGNGAGNDAGVRSGGRQQARRATQHGKTPSTGAAATSATRDQGTARDQRQAEDQLPLPAAASPSRDEADLPRSTGGRHVATKGYYDLSRFNEAASSRAQAATEPARRVGIASGGASEVADTGSSQGSSEGSSKGRQHRSNDGPRATGAESAGRTQPNAADVQTIPSETASAVPCSTGPDPVTVAGTPSGVNDLVVVEGYLARPDVPAIVRSEAMADNIGMPLDRVERVMMRIAEEPERVTRIRPGAYLVRRKPISKVDDGTVGPNA